MRLFLKAMKTVICGSIHRPGQKQQRRAYLGGDEKQQNRSSCGSDVQRQKCQLFS